MSTTPLVLSPAGLVRQGFDWSGKTARLPYLLVTLTLIVAVSAMPLTRTFSPGYTAVFVGLTMLVPIWLGHTRRRLRDVNWSGWCMWLAILPVVSLFLTILLAFKPGADLQSPEKQSYSRVGYAVAMGFGCLMLSRVFWAPYWIPSASMKPTLLIGDFLIATPLSTPHRGDVLVFRHPATEAEWITRLIGLPGDTVQMREGQVILNGTALERTPGVSFEEPYAPQGPARTLPRCSNTPQTEGAPCLKIRQTETLPSGRSYQVLETGLMPLDDTVEFTVPGGAYFFLSDNRDNAIDSRLPIANGGPGLVPAENVTGRVAWVVFSSAGEGLWHVWSWRSDRILKGVR